MPFVLKGTVFRLDLRPYLIVAANHVSTRIQYCYHAYPFTKLHSTWAIEITLHVFSRDIMFDEVSHTLLVLNAAVNMRMCFYIEIPIRDVAIFKLGCLFLWPTMFTSTHLTSMVVETISQGYCSATQQRLVFENGKNKKINCFKVPFVGHAAVWSWWVWHNMTLVLYNCVKYF